MQRRNFRMPVKNHRQKFPAGSNPGKDEKRQYGRPAPAQRPAKPASGGFTTPEIPSPVEPRRQGALAG